MLGSKSTTETMLAAAGVAAGVDVTVEEAFSFAQHMSEEGRKLIAKAQNSPSGSISPEALKTLSLIDSAINTASR
jgi:hypothetical protein